MLNMKSYTKTAVNVNHVAHALIGHFAYFRVRTPTSSGKSIKVDAWIAALKGLCFLHIAAENEAGTRLFEVRPEYCSQHCK